MTTRYPSSCFQAVSCLKRTQHVTPSAIHITYSAALSSQSHTRHYSFSKTSSRTTSARPPAPKSTNLKPRSPAQSTPNSLASALNPPPSTLPPPLSARVERRCQWERGRVRGEERMRAAARGGVQRRRAGDDDVWQRASASCWCCGWVCRHGNGSRDMHVLQ